MAGPCWASSSDVAALRADNTTSRGGGPREGHGRLAARLAHPTARCRTSTRRGFDLSVNELPATAAVLLHEPAFAVAPELPGIWPLLLVGESGRRTYDGFSHARPVTEARALRRTGFFVLAGEPGDAMIVDGSARPCTHGAAAFGYELAVSGLPLVVVTPVGAEQPGTIAEYARSVRARNVLVPSDGAPRDVGAVESRFTVRDGVQYFLGSCQNFAGLGPDVWYRRRVLCMPGRFWIVADELFGTGAFTGESLIHLHPDAVVSTALPSDDRGRAEPCGVDRGAGGRRPEPRARRRRRRSRAPGLVRVANGRLAAGAGRGHPDGGHASALDRICARATIRGDGGAADARGRRVRAASLLADPTTRAESPRCRTKSGCPAVRIAMGVRRPLGAGPQRSARYAWSARPARIYRLRPRPART
jgi:hypothetical protein